MCDSRAATHQSALDGEKKGGEKFANQKFDCCHQTVSGLTGRQIFACDEQRGGGLCVFSCRSIVTLCGDARGSTARP